MRAVLIGIIASVAAAALSACLAPRIGRSDTPEQLRYGPVVWLLGFVSLALALLPVGLTLLLGHDKDMGARIGLLIGFGSGSLYLLTEAVFVRGTYDEDEIVFLSPWTGAKREKWADLLSIELNEWWSWYTLTFRSGKKIRLSQYLQGHLIALEMAETGLQR